MDFVWVFATLGLLSNATALRCYQCSQTSDALCNETSNFNVTQCDGANSSCFTAIKRRGCLANCTNPANWNASNITDVHCCDSDLCNTVGLPSTATTLPHALLTTVEPTSGIQCRSPVSNVSCPSPSPPVTIAPGPTRQCYFCSQQTENACQVTQENKALGKVILKNCSAGEECAVKMHQVFGSVTSFQRECLPRSVCKHSDACVGSVFVAGECVRCCDCNLCNTEDARTNVSCSSPSPPVTIAPGPTRQCYFCSQLTDNACQVTQENIALGRVLLKNCSAGEECVVKMHKEFGTVTLFQRDCIPRSVCKHSDACVGSMLVTGECVRCCDCDTCNSGDAQTSNPCTTSTANSTTILWSISMLACLLVVFLFDQLMH